MRILAHHDLGGVGNVGEGMVIQLARDGRRVLWLAHESAPKNVTALDVSDPRAPTVILQTELPHADMRSNSLDLVGDLLVVAYQTKRVGMQPAGVQLYDVADPGRPRPVSFFDASGPHSRGVHHLWFADGAFVHMSGGAPDFEPRHPKDDQCYRILDVAQHPRPVEVGGWWSPGTARATRRRRRSATSDSTAAFAPTTRTCTRSGLTARGSAIWTAGPSSSTSRTWRSRGS